MALSNNHSITLSHQELIDPLSQLIEWHIGCLCTLVWTGFLYQRSFAIDATKQTIALLRLSVDNIKLRMSVSLEGSSVIHGIVRLKFCFLFLLYKMHFPCHYSSDTCEWIVMDFQRFSSNCTPHICYPNEFWFTAIREKHEHWNTTNNNEFTVHNSRLSPLVNNI